MPERTMDQMDETCRAAYERWIDEARETGRATYDDVWLAAWNAGRSDLRAE